MNRINRGVVAAIKKSLKQLEGSIEKEPVVFIDVRGESNKSIADIMKISPGTVNTHLDNIYSKLGCSNRLSACLIALRNGLFLPGREDRFLKR